MATRRVISRLLVMPSAAPSQRRSMAIGGGSRRSLKSVVDTLHELLGVRVALSYGDRQPGDARDTAADIRRAQQELGFEPAFEFGAGLKAQLEWQEAALAAPQPVLSSR